LRGDAVGKNLSSSKWIIKTLMSLCEIDKNGWTEELEDQLCTLWDLSMEDEVVSFLISHDFAKIAKNTLVTSDKPRLTEIILGIIGNVCSNDEAINTIGCDHELVTQILNCLASDDSLILIQLIRILQLIAWKIRQNPQSKWVAHLTKCEFFGDSINFILKSSTNDDLLIGVMNLLESISVIKLLNENSFLDKLFNIDDLIPALLESFMQIMSTRKKEEISSSEWTFIQHWLAVLIAIMESGSLKFEDYENDERFSKLMEIMYRILKLYTKSYNLYPVQQLTANMICDAVRILLGFHRCDVNVPTRIDRVVAMIIFSLKTVSGSDSENELDPEELITELLDYLYKYWLEIIGFCTSEQLAEILSEREVRECLVSLVRVDSEVIRDKMKKVAIAVENSKNLNKSKNK